MKVKEILEELLKADPEAELEVMVGWSCVPVRTFSGDAEEGYYLELDQE